MKHSPRMWRRVGARWARRGFTMMEILVVLAILGLLAALAINNISNTMDNAKKAAARLFVTQTLKSPLFMYGNHVGSYPTTAEGLNALSAAPSNAGAKWLGPYIETLSLDPWGEPYQYAYPAKHNKSGYDLWSKGPDRQSGTEDDIGNWAEQPK